MVEKALVAWLCATGCHFPPLASDEMTASVSPCWGRYYFARREAGLGTTPVVALGVGDLIQGGSYSPNVTISPPTTISAPPIKTGRPGGLRNTIRFTICQTTNNVEM
jgi:hypothetical protein